MRVSRSMYFWCVCVLFFMGMVEAAIPDACPLCNDCCDETTAYCFNDEVWRCSGGGIEPSCEDWIYWDWEDTCSDYGPGWSCRCDGNPPKGIVAADCNCEEAICPEGMIQCTGVALGREECVYPSTWVAYASCSAGQCCDSGNCWNNGQACGGGLVCDGTSCVAPPSCTDACTPGATRCGGPSSQSVQECQNGCPGTPASWVTTSTCGFTQCCDFTPDPPICYNNNALCNNGWYCDGGTNICDLLTPACNDLCTPGSERCSLGFREDCINGCPGTPAAWSITLDKNCGGAGFGCVGNTCTAPACSLPGVWQCTDGTTSGTIASYCDDSSVPWAWGLTSNCAAQFPGDSCNDPGWCSHPFYPASTAACVDGSPFADTTSCGTGLHCIGGACVSICTNACTPGTYQCNGATNREYCQDGCPGAPGNWVFHSNCNTLSSCYTNSCNGGSCDSPSYVGDGAACPHWAPTAGSGCVAGTCTAATCTTGTKECYSTFWKHTCTATLPYQWGAGTNCQVALPELDCYNIGYCSSGDCFQGAQKPNNTPCPGEGAGCVTGTCTPKQCAVSGQKECYTGTGYRTCNSGNYVPWEYGAYGDCATDLPAITCQDAGVCGGAGVCTRPHRPDQEGCASGMWCISGVCVNYDRCAAPFLDPVAPRGSCADEAPPSTSWTATCNTGWSGSGLGGTCSTDLDGCSGDPCQTGGAGSNTCTDDVPNNGAESPVAQPVTNHDYQRRCQCTVGWDQGGSTDLPTCYNHDGCAIETCNAPQDGGASPAMGSTGTATNGNGCTDAAPGGAQHEAHSCQCKTGWFPATLAGSSSNTIDNNPDSLPRCYDWDGCKDTEDNNSGCNDGSPAGGSAVGSVTGDDATGSTGQDGDGCTDSDPGTGIVHNAHTCQCRVGWFPSTPAGFATNTIDNLPNSLPRCYDWDGCISENYCNSPVGTAFWAVVNGASACTDGTAGVAAQGYPDHDAHQCSCKVGWYPATSASANNVISNGWTGAHQCYNWNGCKDTEDNDSGCNDGDTAGGSALNSDVGAQAGGTGQHGNGCTDTQPVDGVYVHNAHTCQCRVGWFASSPAGFATNTIDNTPNNLPRCYDWDGCISQNYCNSPVGTAFWAVVNGASACTDGTAGVGAQGYPDHDAHNCDCKTGWYPATSASANNVISDGWTVAHQCYNWNGCKDTEDNGVGCNDGDTAGGAAVNSFVGDDRTGSTGMHLDGCTDTQPVDGVYVHNAHTCQCRVGWFPSTPSSFATNTIDNAPNSLPRCYDWDGCISQNYCNSPVGTAFWAVVNGASACTDGTAGVGAQGYPDHDAHNCDCKTGWYPATSASANNVISDGWTVAHQCYNWNGCKETEDNGSGCNDGDVGGGSTGTGQHGFGCTDTQPSGTVLQHNAHTCQCRMGWIPTTGTGLAENNLPDSLPRCYDYDACVLGGWPGGAYSGQVNGNTRCQSGTRPDMQSTCNDEHPTPGVALAIMDLYTCNCAAGWKQVGHPRPMCQDEDGCYGDLRHLCDDGPGFPEIGDAGALCTDVAAPGTGYFCTCSGPAWKLTQHINGTCANYDECTEGGGIAACASHGDPGSSCDDNIAPAVGFTCICGPGFTYQDDGSGEGGFCREIDSCKELDGAISQADIGDDNCILLDTKAKCVDRAGPLTGYDCVCSDYEAWDESGSNSLGTETCVNHDACGSAPELGTNTCRGLASGTLPAQAQPDNVGTYAGSLGARCNDHVAPLVGYDCTCSSAAWYEDNPTTNGPAVCRNVDACLTDLTNTEGGTDACRSLGDVGAVCNDWPAAVDAVDRSPFGFFFEPGKGYDCTCTTAQNRWVYDVGTALAGCASCGQKVCRNYDNCHPLEGNALNTHCRGYGDVQALCHDTLAPDYGHTCTCSTPNPGSPLPLTPAPPTWASEDEAYEFGDVYPYGSCQNVDGCLINGGNPCNNDGNPVPGVYTSNPHYPLADAGAVCADRASPLNSYICTACGAGFYDWSADELGRAPMCVNQDACLMGAAASCVADGDELALCTDLAPPTVAGHGLGGYVCTCSSAAFYWDGATCAEVDDCLAAVPGNVPASNPGGYNGLAQCQSSGDGSATCWNKDGPTRGYDCVCGSSGWDGSSGICENIDGCVTGLPTCKSAGDPSATCDDRAAPLIGHDCVCSAGYTQRNGICKNDNECLSNPCQNGGECSQSCGDNCFVCDCADTGYQGLTCTVPVIGDDCVSAPCQHGGFCTDTGAFSYSCDCTGTGYVGDICQNDEDDCLSSPCLNGGSCTDIGFKAYSCECLEGWKGLLDCSQNYDSCIDGNALLRCQNYGLAGGDVGASCTDKPAPGHGFYCTCTDDVAWEIVDNMCVNVDSCSEANGAREVCRSNGDIEATCVDRVAPLAGYNCGCTAAKTYSEIDAPFGTCVEVDDCIGNPCDDAGDVDSICVDDAAPSPGHSCICSGPGWFDNAGLCSNVDACGAGTGDGTSSCQTFFTAGDGASCNDRGAPLTGFTCTCPGGTEEVAGVCVEIDDCLLQNDNGDLSCQADGHTGAVCLDVASPGTGFTCDCVDLVAWEVALIAGREICRNRNACASGGLAACQTSDGGAVCTDNVAPLTGYACTCSSHAWRPDGAGPSCVDVDGCAGSPCASHGDVGATCSNKIAPLSGHVCSACTSGYRLMNNECIDIDKCAEGGLANCRVWGDSIAGCTDDAGASTLGYTCQCSTAGWIDINGFCVDVDGCSALYDDGLNKCRTGGTAADPAAQCVDTPAPLVGYSCDCSTEGYDGSTGVCNNIDSCNQDGAYTCDDAGDVGASCVDRTAPLHGLDCSCSAGFDETLEPGMCRDMDDCDPNPCQNGGLCDDTGPNSYLCDCTGTGFTDATCSTPVGNDDCASNPCFSGVCNDAGAFAFTCDCTGTGYSGTLCDTDVSDCTSNPCQNGGTCVDLGPNAHGCICEPGYYGPVDCAIDYPACAVIGDDGTTKCQSAGDTGAVCNDAAAPFSGFTCTCSVGYEVNAAGDVCIETDGCRENNPFPGHYDRWCKFGGDLGATCNDRVSPLEGNTCTCTVGGGWVQSSHIALAPNAITCIDYDACAAGGLAACRSTGDTFAECVDDLPPSPGHSCVCSGTGWWDDNGVCRDKDGCSALWENGGVVCATLDAGAVCVDQNALDTVRPEGYTCTCSDSSAWIDDTPGLNMCIDRNACTLDGGLNKCQHLGDDLATCTNHIAPLSGYTCTCSNIGWDGTSGECVHLDGCAEVFAPEAPLTGSQACTMFDVGAVCEDRLDTSVDTFPHKCTCSLGYSDFGDGISRGVCSDFDACWSNPCQAYGDGTAICADLPPPSTAYTCSCSSGYYPLGEAHASICDNTDACVAQGGNDQCLVGGDVHATCSDNPPPLDGYVCNCLANAAVYDALTNTCIDKDSCLPAYENGLASCRSGGDTGAVCVDKPMPANGFDCVCSTTGYEGASGACINVNACGSNTCKNGGDTLATCTDVAAPGTGYTCNCDLGYEDVLGTCTDMDDCLSTPCQNGGTCTDQGVAVYTCDCTGTGYDGLQCQNFIVGDDCGAPAGFPCLPGSCTDTGAGTYSCDCTGTGFEGAECDQNINDCASCPCLHGGSCTDGVLTFTCDCSATGFTGPTCTVDFDACGNLFDGLGLDNCRDLSGANVDNAAVCVDAPAPEAGYSCTPSMPGVDCSTGFCLEIDGCAAMYTIHGYQITGSDACKSQGDTSALCSDVGAPAVGYTCGCTAGYTEINGECVNIDGCAGHLCGAAGDTFADCVDVAPPGVGYTCICTSSGWFDNAGICTDVNECLTGPPGLGGTASCQSGDDPAATCNPVSAPALGFTCTASTGGYDCSTGVCNERDGCTQDLGTSLCRSSGNAKATCLDQLAPLTGHTCNCTRGFEDVSGVCKNIDACATQGGTASCQSLGDVGATCGDNLAPRNGFFCECSVGYYADKGLCKDQDACTELGGLAECQSRGDVSATCADLPAPSTSHVCTCGTGFEPSADGLTCVDIDECAAGGLATCRAGVPQADLTAQCTDIAAPGVGFTCTCSDGGWQVVGSTCQNIDDCSALHGNGDVLCISGGDGGAVCVDVNAPGTGYTCTPSDAGAWECSGGVCVNINACLAQGGLDFCRSGGDGLATCSDKVAPLNGYTCACSSVAFALDGTGKCVDVDECANGGTASCKAGGYASATCSSIAAPLTGFQCGCDVAPEPNSWYSDGSTCLQIDACADQGGDDACKSGGDAGATCVDHPPPGGSSGADAYFCLPSNAQAYDCTNGPCSNIDACVVQGGTASCQGGVNPDATAVCFDIPAPGVGFTCTCSGLGWHALAGKCEDVNGCVDNPCDDNGDAGAVCADVAAPGIGHTCVSCSPGYKLEDNECRDIDACIDFSGLSQCRSAGDLVATCTDLPPPSLGYTCDCVVTGYDGTSGVCVDVDDCSAAYADGLTQCRSGGDVTALCHDKVAPQTGFTCSTSGAGWDCSTNVCVDVNGCVGNTCAIVDAGGICIDTPGPATGYSCTCSIGFVDNGGTCLNGDECASSPCENGGLCSDGALPDTFDCACAGTGFDGAICDNPVSGDDCVSEPCLHTALGASCVDEGANAFSCDCGTSGYEGGLCQTDIDDCISAPCQHGGVCSDAGPNAFACDCTNTGYEGAECELDYDGCSSGGGLAACQSGDDPGASCLDVLAPALGHTCVPSQPTGFDCTSGVCLEIDGCVAANDDGLQQCRSEGDSGANCNNLLPPLVGYTCACSAGYEAVDGVCVNIDDCSAAHMNGNANCKANGDLFAVCQDELPPLLGYSCLCADASRFDDGVTCTNVDACVSQGGSAACESLASPYDGTCVDAAAPGTGFTCTPNGPGTDCSSGTCVEYDACMVGGGNQLCISAGDTGATCLDALAPGVGHSCNCTRGYFDNSGVCADFNSCSMGGGLALCQSLGDAAATCGDVNAPGVGHLCECSAGYVANKGKCENFDACATIGGANGDVVCASNGDVNAICVDDAPPSVGFNCSCGAGYRRQNALDGSDSCVDIDACVHKGGLASCQSGGDVFASCFDVAAPGTGWTCVGSSPGWDCSSGVCLDINECTLTGDSACVLQGDVDVGASCVDAAAPGVGYSCVPSGPGYYCLDSDTCYNVDACSDEGAEIACRSLGDTSATCVDVAAPGVGYSCACSSAAWFDNGGLCANIDSCAAGGSVACTSNDAAAVCTDLPAPQHGYVCTCSSVAFEFDGTTCVDVDACAVSGTTSCRAGGDVGAICNDQLAPGVGFTCTASDSLAYACGGTTCVDRDACTTQGGLVSCRSGGDAGASCGDVVAPGTGFDCVCSAPGWEYDGAGKCVDIDGCAGGSNPCHAGGDVGSVCSDVVAPSIGFVCSGCSAGFTLINNMCVDINACLSLGGLEQCQAAGDASAGCVDNAAPLAGYTCVCSSGDGFEDNGQGVCIDSDDCANGGLVVCRSDADANAICVSANFPLTGYTCYPSDPQVYECPGGSVCVDKDGCLGHQCNQNDVGATCVDEPAPGVGHTCSCSGGFWYDADTTETCRDIDDCASSPCLNGGDCVDAGADAFQCDCLGSGYDGATCNNVILTDGCTPNPCSNGALCTDTGANTFSCDCGTSGYSGATCSADVNDCASSPCQHGGVCTDTGANSFSCACTEPGYTGVVCADDVNGCVGHLCDVVVDGTATCNDVSAPGVGYTCTCSSPAYVFDAFASGTGACVDCDDCIAAPYHGTINCASQGDAGAICVDLVAPAEGYTCSCSSGFVDEDGVCVAENGCAVGDVLCAAGGDAFADCVDVAAPGTGYICSCSDSNAFHEVGGTCVDLDACADPTADAACKSQGDSSGSCVDVFAPGGGYTCSCGAGFDGATGVCIDVNACAADVYLGTCTGAGDNDAFCEDRVAPLSDFACNCTAGYVDNGAGVCVNFDACVAGGGHGECASLGDVGSVCVDLLPPSVSHSCQCSAGYYHKSGLCKDIDGCLAGSGDGTVMCGSAGDSQSMCIDSEPPATDWNCSCSAGFVASANGICVDYDACFGSNGGQSCVNGGDSFAACIDSPAPNLGFTCFCSSAAYAFDADSRSCVDHDACVGHLCNAGNDTTATCTDNAAPLSGYSCECDAGYTVVSGACMRAECPENAVIMNGTETCVCAAGYIASPAEPVVWNDADQQWDGTCVAIVSCASSPCVNGGECYEEQPSGYYCDCSGTGYEGTRCETDVVDCKDNYCNGRGDEMEGTNKCSCDCYYGYEGPKCSKDRNHCHSQPCQHNTKCDSVGKGANSTYVCECKFSGFEGRDCSEDYDDCQSSPCMHGGTCADTGRNSFECKCVKPTNSTVGYTDSICQTPVYWSDVQDALGNDNEEGSTRQDNILAGANNYEFIIMTCVMAFLLLVLIFVLLRFSMRGKERVFVNEKGEAFVMDETTGTTKRAAFDVEHHMSFGNAGGDSSLSLPGEVGKTKTKHVISIGHGGRFSTISNAMSLDVRSSSSSVVTSDSEPGSSDSEATRRRHLVDRLSKMSTRRTSIDLMASAFNMDAEDVRTAISVLRETNSSSSAVEIHTSEDDETYADIINS